MADLRLTPEERHRLVLEILDIPNPDSLEERFKRFFRTEIDFGYRFFDRFDIFIEILVPSLILRAIVYLIAIMSLLVGLIWSIEYSMMYFEIEKLKPEEHPWILGGCAFFVFFVILIDAFGFLLTEHIYIIEDLKYICRTLWLFYTERFIH